jgi:hypothetical protein
MEVVNTLAYYNTATIIAVKSFIIHSDLGAVRVGSYLSRLDLKNLARNKRSSLLCDVTDEEEKRGGLLNI